MARPLFLLLALAAGALAQAPALPDGLKPGDTLRVGAYDVQILRVYGRWDPTDTARWGAPAEVNGLKDWTLPFRKVIAAAGAFAAANKTIETVDIPAGDFGLCPQATDPASERIWQRCINLPSNVVLKGQGPDKTKLLFFSKGMKDPKTSWTNTGDGYVKISRGGIFRITSTVGYGGAKSNIGLRDLTVDGQAGYTGNFVVGGNTFTGDGWDMTHKAFAMDGSNPIDKIEIVNCVLQNWRGEIVYSGGSQIGSVHIADCTIKGSNASAVSCSANLLMERCQIGGTAVGEDVYNGTENFAVRSPQKSVYRSVKIRVRNGAAGGNGFVQLGGKDTSTTIEDCEVTGGSIGILAADFLHNLTVRRSKFACTNSVTTTGLGLYPEVTADRGFSNLLFEDCTHDSTGSFYVSQGPAPDKERSVPGLRFARPILLRGNLMSGQYWGSNWTDFSVTDADVRLAAKPLGSFAGNNSPIWTGTKYDPAATLAQKASTKIDVFAAGTTSVNVSPRGDFTWLNAKPAGTVTASIDVAANRFPVGFKTRILAGSAGWVVKEGDRSWPVPTGGIGIVLQVGADGRFAVPAAE